MNVRGAAALAGVFLAAASSAQAATATRGRFGVLADGAPVEAVTLANGHGVSARVVAWGAMLQSLVAPDRAGRRADVVLAYPDMTGYLAKTQFFGSTVGRVANRIAHGTFTLDGRTYRLARNDGPNALHGGVHGFDKQVWTIAEVKSGPVASVTLTRTSLDGEEGYPGALKVSVTYALNERNELSLHFTATTDKPTLVNLSNHSYFNMAGAASGRTVYDQRLTLVADNFTPVDAGLIPTGEIRPVAGTPFDFRTPHPVGERIADGRDPQVVIGRGYDHNWVLNGGVRAAPRLAARLEDPASGRVLELSTTEPGLQVYSSNSMNATVVGAGHTIYRQGAGLALEPQHFPDSPHHPNFPSVRLDPGQIYQATTVYRLTTAPR